MKGMTYKYNTLYKMYLGSDGHMYYPHEVPDSKRNFVLEGKVK